MRISLNVLRGNSNAVNICKAFARGIVAQGDKASIRSEKDRSMEGFDAAAFWGYVTSCQQVEAACRAKGIPFVYFDLAYWQRERYYKVAVNARHPTAYMMKRDMPPDRWNKLGLKLAPWKIGGSGAVLVAGMSGKASWSWGMKDEQYERTVIPHLATFTERHIIYRPKPSWPDAKPIPGSSFDLRTPINKLLEDCHCVVSHHSNVGVDAIVAGVPVITRHGAAVHVGLHDTFLSRVDTPAYPDGREQFVANLAYCQWTLQEMASGQCWKHVRSVVKEQLDARSDLTASA